jgi:hypothetical protein
MRLSFSASWVLCSHSAILRFSGFQDGSRKPGARDVVLGRWFASFRSLENARIIRPEPTTMVWEIVGLSLSGRPTPSQIDFVHPSSQPLAYIATPRSTCSQSRANPEGCRAPLLSINSSSLIYFRIRTRDSGYSIYRRNVPSSLGIKSQFSAEPSERTKPRDPSN